MSPLTIKLADHFKSRVIGAVLTVAVCFLLYVIWDNPAAPLFYLAALVGGRHPDSM